MSITLYRHVPNPTFKYKTRRKRLARDKYLGFCDCKSFQVSIMFQIKAKNLLKCYTLQVSNFKYQTWVKRLVSDKRTSFRVYRVGDKEQNFNRLSTWPPGQHQAQKPPIGGRPETIRLGQVEGSGQVRLGKVVNASLGHGRGNPWVRMRG